MMIILHLILHSAVHIYDLHIFITSSSSFHGFRTNQHAPSWLVSLHRSRPISQRSRVRIPYKNAKVAYETAMTILHLILRSTVHIYDFHIFINSINH